MVKKIVRKRARGRGFSLLEIIVAIAIIAMISAAVTVAIVAQKQKADISLTRTNAQTILTGVQTWMLEHGDGCPTLQTLMSDGQLARGKSLKSDAWQQPWRIECKEHEVGVVSNGPDKTAGTEDDIVVPEG
ncbi:MAG TPA: prepilin-type N-terminal cleavage/methylation domain-containing protein [Polyangiaceae bacterium]|nr:prepilin-type N-terminal cleavage/methylation domain-containing protein [Polyangiaceae bacterium]